MQMTTDVLPLAADTDGVVRVGATRVTLDTVVAASRAGMTPEGIVEQYPSLRLADVYLVIGYILGYPDKVGAYLHGREKLADAVRRENENRWDPDGIRDRLIARRV